MATQRRIEYRVRRCLGCGKWLPKRKWKRRRRTVEVALGLRYAGGRRRKRPRRRKGRPGGRQPRYCSTKCKQQAYRDQRRALIPVAELTGDMHARRRRAMRALREDARHRKVQDALDYARAVSRYVHAVVKYLRLCDDLKAIGRRPPPFPLKEPRYRGEPMRWMDDYPDEPPAAEPGPELSTSENFRLVIKRCQNYRSRKK